jgi:flagellar M-ring protein FliF
MQKDIRRVERTVIEPDKDGKGYEKSRKLTSEEYQGTMKTAGGTATKSTAANGTTAGNIVQVEGPAGPRPSYKQTLQQVEFDYSRRVESVQDTPNRIRRITASVVVDGLAKLDTSSQDALKKAIGLAIGIDSTRGDECTLQVLAFNHSQDVKDTAVEVAPPQVAASPFLWVLVGLGSALGMIALVAIIRRRRRKPTLEAQLLADEAAAGTAALVGGKVDIALPAEAESTAEREGRSLLERARAAALANPELVARVIQNWVNNERAMR